MKYIWSIIYNIIVVPFGIAFYYLFSIFSTKMRKGIKGRRKTFKIIRSLRKKYPDDEIILFHSASLGEYEQVKPVIKETKRKHPKIITVVSFTSPSGYENANRTAAVDQYIYLPFDFYFTTKKFVKILNPIKIIFVTYELWPNLLVAAKNQQIETFLISARLRAKSKKWRFYIKSYFASLYSSLDNIFTATQSDKRELKKIIQNPSMNLLSLGDTRYDQVIQRAEKRSNKNIPQFFSDGTVICAGSVWEQDQQQIAQPLIDFLKKNNSIKLIMAPHETDKLHVNAIISTFESAGIQCSKYSTLDNTCQTSVLVVDKIGVLAELYHQSDIAFVGGSFKKAVHNVMEPAIAGIPVLFGPFYHNSREAEQLVEKGGGFSCGDSKIFSDHLTKLLTDKKMYQNASKRSKEVIIKNKGASQRTVEQIFNA